MNGTTPPSSDIWEWLVPWSLPVSFQILTNHFSDLGAAYGTAKSGVGISSMGVLKPELIMKSIVPVVMAGVLGIYGLIISVILNQKSITFELNR